MQPKSGHAAARRNVCAETAVASVATAAMARLVERKAGLTILTVYCTRSERANEQDQGGRSERDRRRAR